MGSGGYMKKHYDVKGMTCSACANIIEKTLTKQQGISNINVNLLSNSMDIEYDASIINEEAIIKTVDGLGYKVITDTIVKEYDEESQQQKYKLILSIVFMVLLFYISMGHMMHWPLLDLFHQKEHLLTFAFTQFILSLPIYILNAHYFTHGFKSLAKKHPNMDSLIAIGSLASMLYGIYAIYKLGYFISTQNMEAAHAISMDLYFETGAMILTLISLGKYLESKSKKKTSEAISKLVNLQAKTATILKDGKEIEVDIHQVAVNDIVIVKQGTIIPSDGTIIYGSSSVDESMITGESIPVEKTIGHTVIGATMNLSGYLQIQVSKSVEDSTLSSIIKLVEQASNSKAPIAKLADQLSGIFVPIVIVISLISFITWLFITKNFEQSMSFAIAVLVISCPCALGLATPVSIMVSTGVAASNGILIKSAKTLETTGKIKTILLDKTGTITKGKPHVVNIHSFKEDFTRIAYSLEKQSSHPLSKAIVDFFTYEAITFDDFTQLDGKGILSHLKQDRYLAGNLRLMNDYNVKMDAYINRIDEASKQGHTPLIFALNDEVIGIIEVADTIKETSIQAIKELQKMNIDVVMLTGDNPLVAKNIADKVNIKEFKAGILPAEKHEYVLQYQKHGNVAMVGDGINDSIALASADVGIAIGSGSDIAIESADVILVKDNLMDVANFIRLSQKTMLNIKENLFWALIYNTIGIPLAAGLFYLPFGLKLNPMFGAFAMSISSVSVVLNALRIRKFKPIKSKGEETMIKQVMIEGMSCKHCVKHVSDALNAISGIQATVDLASNSATLTCASNIDDQVITTAIEHAGYTVKDIKHL